MNQFAEDNRLIISFNFLGVVASYVLLSISLYMSPEVPLSTKGFWGIAVLMLTLSLVNFVKYRFDARLSNDRIQRIEDARNERLLEEYVTTDKSS
ncbi:hypothetical protein [Jannaschia pohangensis]|uniref:YiaAB two helix domain-containing protein n=1 Tax=Jannaschia pohangensis TaxID=390807 RepID=A0A1I3R999_9RHOB|nr:hypothetical protein [Jannaschia pohangensis]SFJ41961.1 hypothetical protein SAMN04488095_2809 [Jannaschia pohangensis]